MQIFELSTVNGRVFRVAIENKSQKARLDKVLYKNKKKTYEKFISVKCIENGIHSVKDFETLAESLV